MNQNFSDLRFKYCKQLSLKKHKIKYFLLKYFCLYQRLNELVQNKENKVEINEKGWFFVSRNVIKWQKKASCLDNPVDNDVHKKYLQYIIRKVEEASSYLLGLLVRTQFGED